MEQGQGKQSKDPGWGCLGPVLIGVAVLSIGWFVGFRPIQWAIDFADSTIPSPQPSTAYTPPPDPVYETEAPDPPAPWQPSVDSWSCFWDPTMNEDWHDDVLCTNGAQRDRPLLLTDWGYVTYDDMMVAAADYEDWLNSR